MIVNWDLPESLAAELSTAGKDLPQILELGIRRWTTRDSGEFDDVADVWETLASLPTPEAVLALRPSDRLQSRMSELLEKNRTTGLTAAEEREWRHFEYLEHLVRIAKSNASRRLKPAGSQNGE